LLSSKVFGVSDRDFIDVGELRDSRDVTIVDIRRKPDDRKIPGSIRQNGETLTVSEVLPFAPGERVVVYCGSGNTCSLVAEQLRRRGVDARALEGGYAAWKDAGLPTDPL
jgi:rhodanese-related sulfurtransferase